MKRLKNVYGDSFKIVSEKLETVHKGLGEMQVLATGVGDLKKVLTNVKSRGNWGEFQLANILSQFLTSEQYETNVATRPRSQERVEFAIKLPGKDLNESVLLPVDSKFPIENYERLVDSEEQGDFEKVDASKKSLYESVKAFAREITKYICVPKTTDFAIMFLPTESLYCEIVKNTSLVEEIANKYRVVVAGPSTFVALLNSLQMGFRTLAIEKRSSEVWKILGAVKTEFNRFGTILENTNRQLQIVANSMESAQNRTIQMQKKLKSVEVIDYDKSEEILEITGDTE
jgi:DNA recombination protein RmuC